MSDIPDVYSCEEHDNYGRPIGDPCANCTIDALHAEVERLRAVIQGSRAKLAVDDDAGAFELLTEAREALEDKP